MSEIPGEFCRTILEVSLRKLDRFLKSSWEVFCELFRQNHQKFLSWFLRIFEEFARVTFKNFIEIFIKKVQGIFLAKFLKALSVSSKLLIIERKEVPF